MECHPGWRSVTWAASPSFTPALPPKQEWGKSQPKVLSTECLALRWVCLTYYSPQQLKRQRQPPKYASRCLPPPSGGEGIIVLQEIEHQEVWGFCPRECPSAHTREQPLGLYGLDAIPSPIPPYLNSIHPPETWSFSRLYHSFRTPSLLTLMDRSLLCMRHHSPSTLTLPHVLTLTVESGLHYQLQVHPEAPFSQSL